jgi:hypothetical protein
VAFCALALLEPVSGSLTLAVLLWPAIVAGALLARAFPAPALSRYLLWIAVVMQGCAPLIPGRQTARFFDNAGLDFWTACLLTAGLSVAWYGARASSLAPRPHLPPVQRMS